MGSRSLCALAERGWSVAVDARDGAALRRAVAGLDKVTCGSRRCHRRRTPRARSSTPPATAIDLLVNNASLLGPTPQPSLADYPLAELARRLRRQRLRPARAWLSSRCRGFAPGAAIVNVTSDAAVEPYEGWGGYGSSKAALEQLTAVLAAEHPGARVYSVDPGDMRTQMHQDAFPGEDISDRPPPEESVPGLLALIEGSLPSGRYRARELAGCRRERTRAARTSASRRTSRPRYADAGRDDVAMLVATRQRRRRSSHARFADLPRLSASPATSSSSTRRRRLPAALDARLGDRERRAPPLDSYPAPGRGRRRHWVVELRTARRRCPSAGRRSRSRLDLAGGARAELLARYAGSDRLSVARLDLGLPLPDYLARHGRPIRYGYVPRAWPLDAYQTVFAHEPGQRGDAERGPAVHRRSS